MGRLMFAVALVVLGASIAQADRYTPSLPLAIALARFFGTTVEEVFDADH